MASESVVVQAGLEGVIAAATRLSAVDGLAGELVIAGFALEELAPNATFEEAVYVLWHDRLPSPAELAGFRQELATNRALPAAVLPVLKDAADRNVPPMDALRMATGMLEAGDSDDQIVQATTILAQLPTIVAAYHRLGDGKEPVAPDPGLGHTANYLWMLTGSRPDDEQVRALETYLNTVIDHGLNASTFAARVIIATRSDLVSAITGAIGALKGPLHGGAPSKVLDMLLEIGTAENVEPWLEAAFNRGDRLMGFGHRVYKAEDPRAEILRTMAEHASDPAFFALSKTTEEKALALLNERKPGRKLYTNVEFYSAAVLAAVGLPGDMFTPTFAVARSVGWSAHVLEQVSNNRLIRPQSEFIGRTDRTFTLVKDR